MWVLKFSGPTPSLDLTQKSFGGKSQTCSCVCLLSLALQSAVLERPNFQRTSSISHSRQFLSKHMAQSFCDTQNSAFQSLSEYETLDFLQLISYGKFGIRDYYFMENCLKQRKTIPLDLYFYIMPCKTLEVPMEKSQGASGKAKVCDRYFLLSRYPCISRYFRDSQLCWESEWKWHLPLWDGARKTTILFLYFLFFCLGYLKVMCNVGLHLQTNKPVQLSHRIQV